MRHLPTSDEDKYSNGFASKVRTWCFLFSPVPYLRVKPSSASAAALDLAPFSQTPPRASSLGRGMEPFQKPSEWPQFNGSGRMPDSLGRNDRRNVTNPTMSLSPNLGDLPTKVNGSVSGTTTPLLQQVSHGLAQGLGSRRGSPLSLGDTLSSITSARSVPATPLPGMPGSAGPIAKAPGTPLSGDPHNISGILSAQMSRQLSEDNELNPSLSRMPSGQFDNSPISFNSIQSGIDDVSVDRQMMWFHLMMLMLLHSSTTVMVCTGFPAVWMEDVSTLTGLRQAAAGLLLELLARLRCITTTVPSMAST